MASRTARVVWGIVGGVVGLAVLVVVGLFAWVAFRPLLVGDYSHTYGYMRTVNELNEVPLSAMVSSTGTPFNAESGENLSNRIANTIGQIDVLVEEVDGALDSRAGEKDDELRERLEGLSAAYAELRGTLETWSGDGYELVGEAAKQCVVGTPECADAVQDAEAAAPASESLIAVLEGARLVADGGSSDELTAALEAFGAEVSGLWQDVESQAESATEYLLEHGQIDE